MLQAIMSTETLRIVYFAYIHSIMSYGIIFGGKSTIQWEDLQNSKKGDQNYHKFKNERFMYGTVSKIRNITPVLTIYFLSINIRDKTQTFK